MVAMPDPPLIRRLVQRSDAPVSVSPALPLERRVGQTSDQQSGDPVWEAAEGYFVQWQLSSVQARGTRSG